MDKIAEALIHAGIRAIIAPSLVDRDAEKRIRGFISIVIKASKGNVGLVAVDPSYRSRSVGTVLMKSAFIALRQRGAKTVTVTTQKTNSIGCLFYESVGFRRQHIQRRLTLVPKCRVKFLTRHIGVVSLIQTVG